jgi:hypothetical protein
MRLVLSVTAAAKQLSIAASAQSVEPRDVFITQKNGQSLSGKLLVGDSRSIELRTETGQQLSLDTQRIECISFVRGECHVRVAPAQPTATPTVMPTPASGDSVGAKEDSIKDVSGGWKAYDHVDENGTHVRALVVQGVVVGNKDKAAVMMLHQRQDGSWSVGFGLSIKGYTSPITIRADNETPIQSLWRMTPDKGGTNAVLPLGDHQVFLGDLQTTKVFELTYPRYPDMAKVILRFDVRGLSIALKKLKTERD